ncbi:MAG: hypothetical protein AB8B81_19975 [Halioglobus sp.]
MRHYLRRAVDQDEEVADVYLQSKRDGAAAYGTKVADKLSELFEEEEGEYGAALELIEDLIQKLDVKGSTYQTSDHYDELDIDVWALHH